MRRRTTLVLAPALLIALAAPCLAWGVKGHDWIVQNAVDLLPDSGLKTYMEKSVMELRFDALEPDFEWKDGTHARFEYPNHYFDLEIFGDAPTPADIPRTRLDALRFFNEKGLAGKHVGFLPYRIEELYLELVNAMTASPGDARFIAGVLAHYSADATQPLHSTIHFDGRADERVDGRKAFSGIHMDYEVSFLEDQGLEFLNSSRELAEDAEALDDVHGAALATIFEAHGHFEEVYAAARAENGEGKYSAWDESIGPMTRLQLARAATFAASLWLTAWEKAGKPELE